ncbi:MAG: UdgX family uracil-DNA binding protein [Pseudomonadota bacterium]
MPLVQLAGPTDWLGFQRATRHLIRHGRVPAEIQWATQSASPVDLFQAEDTWQASELGDHVPPVSLPAGFVALAQDVLLHDDAGRFERLYRMAWRLSRDRRLWQDPLDPGRGELEKMAHAVRREMHKMKAFVRFREVEVAPGSVRHVAWFEPAHHVVEAVAPFFVRRFTHMEWAVLTPRCCVSWHDGQLASAAGASRDSAPPADAGEALWLAYYASIFNPARLKVDMMRKEMPVRFWKNLPEATLIAPLVAGSAQRTGTMVESPGTERQRRRGHIDVPGAGAGCFPAVLEAPEATEGDALAERLLGEPATMADLAQQARRCTACPIGACATQSVWGEGPLQARLMMVGEQPGDREDLEGRPFVGPAGHLLRRAFGRLGWSRDALYLTNAVKHFKYTWRGKRRIHKTAAQQEAAACAHWLEREIGLVQPQALVAMGATAARSLLGAPVLIEANAGHWLRRADGLPVLVVHHPAALLRLPSAQQAPAFERWVAMLQQATAFVVPPVGLDTVPRAPTSQAMALST